MLHENILYFDNRFDYPLITHGKGIYLYDENGKEYIDGCSGAISCSLGHGRSDMAEVMKTQAETLAYVHRHHVSAKIVNEATTLLKEAFPVMDKFFMVSGGTEATEVATKLARLHFYDKGLSGKNKIIGRWMSYHGYTLDALSYGGNPGRRKEFAAVLREDGHIMPPYCYRCWAGKTKDTCAYECANALEDMILSNGADTVAGFICETIVGTTLGCVTPPIGYYQRIREICDKYNVLMIMDEVMCGSGRTGTMTAIEQYGVVPDIIALAKSIGGGYFPIGVVGATATVAAPIEEVGMFPVGHTWSGSPLSSAVIKKTLEIIRDENLLENVKNMGEYLKESLEKLADKHTSVGDIRGRGLMQAIELVADRETKKCFDKSLHIGDRIANHCMEKGLIVMVSSNVDKGQQGDAIMIGPNFEVTKEEIDKIIQILDQVLLKTIGEKNY